MSVGIGLIGCGRAATAVHLPLLRRMEGVRLVAAADPDPARRAAAPDLRWMSDYQELLAYAGVEAVVICLPTGMHADAACAALEAGKHVYLEKPLAAELAGAERVLQAWRASGRVGMIGFNYRFNPLYSQLREVVRAGRLGGVISMRSTFSTPTRPMPEWKRKRGEGGGVLLDMASHHIDLARWYFGEAVVEVSAQVASRGQDQDTAALQMRTEGGILIQTFCATGCVEEDRIDLYGDKGHAWADRYRSTEVRVAAPTEVHSRFGGLAAQVRSVRSAAYLVRKLREPWGEPSFAPALRAFVTAVGEGRVASSPGLQDGFESLRVVLAAEEAASSGRTVRIEG
jgi:predicted dehydrogenase